MRTRTILSGWRAALLAGLGLPTAAACGGTVESANPPLQLRFPCVNPKPFNGGFVACDGGFLHRPAPVDCPAPPAPTSCAAGSSCQTDSECGGGLSRCLSTPGGQCECWNSTCLNDADCAYPGESIVCQCGDSTSEPGSSCQAARCKSDAECGGFLCASATLAPVSGCGTSTFACQTASDECMSDSNCVAPAQCFFDGGKRVCEARPCVTGRPFLVGGIPRTADVTERSDWSTVACAPRIDGLDAELRARLCAEWTRVGLMEHASVAAFARFTLELLALAAPAPLVEASNRALADETVHARLAFGLASAYGGRPIGPGSLDVRGALDIANHRDIVRCVIAEGCLGETIAAAEAVEALDRAKDPAVRRVLARIAADERRHAELAWRFVQWALEHSSLELREAARGGLLEILAGDGVTWEADGTASTCSQNDDAPGGTSAHGILPDSARRDVAARVFTDVVRPCAAALLRRNSQARAA